MRYTLYLLAIFAFTGAARAQSAAEDSVRTAVNLLFTGMKAADPDIIRRSFADSAILQTITTNKDGKTVVRSENIEEFARTIAKLGQGVADERIQFDQIRIDGPLAMVWAPYSFYYKGQLNHCGVDSFQLLLVDGGRSSILSIRGVNSLVSNRRPQRAWGR